ncbi:MAG TPA: DUF835 domain-containing protein [Thermoplasmata archaeon]|nr:DUF835 domain-containing protein [Thermoplasmata archaeon]
MDANEIILEVLPALVGLAILGYFAFEVRKSAPRFFRTMRSWVVTTFVVSLAALLLFNLARFVIEGISDSLSTLSDIAFIIVASWLSVFLVGLTTRYSQQDEVDHFATWIKAKPVNILTIWGMIGFVLALIAISDYPEPTEVIAESSWLTALVLLYILGSASIEIAFLSTPREGVYAGLTRETKVSIAALPIVWTAIVAILFALGLVIGFGLGYEEADLSTWILTLLFALMVRLTLSTRFVAIVIDPEVETVRKGGFREFDIPRGAYLIHDEKPDSAFALFSELVTLPLRPDAEIPGTEDSASATLEFLIPKGLVVTREFPEVIRERYNIQVTPIIWLTESPGEMRIAPTSLAMLTDTIIRFMESNPNSIVLLDGIEYVVTFNEFKKVLRTLDTLNETAWITKSRLLVAVHPHAFDEKDLALLERDRKVVRGVSGVIELMRESRVYAKHG